MNIDQFRDVSLHFGDRAGVVGKQAHRRGPPAFL